MKAEQQKVVTYRGKRLLDVLLSAAGLIVLFPVVVLVGVLVRVILGPPVFFRQERPGVFGRSFTIFKFRTMTDERDKSGQPLPDGKRLGVFGQFLRRSSLDELPELWNVLRGDMSLVGPRPLLPEYLPFYRPRERLRFHVKPGITGLAQISGRNLVNWDNRLEFDAVYVENISLAADLSILIRTVGIVFLGRGASSNADEVENRLDNERAQEQQALVTAPN